MRILAILCIVAAALTSSIAANAEGAQGKRGKGQDMGAIRDKCMAEAVGFGVNKSAQVRACVQRAKKR
jgi:hypothetical protein